jgi:hypothetical protein
MDTMRKRYQCLAVILGAALAVAALGANLANAEGESVSGIWTLKVEGIGLKLELAQEKTTVTGTLDWPHGDPIKLTGSFKDDTLTFAGDSGGENFTIHVKSTGMLGADGTMAGTIEAHFVDLNDAHEVVREMNQQIPWTAERGEHGIVHFGK